MKNNDSQTPINPLMHNIGFLLSWVAEASQQHYEAALKTLNLTPHHVGVLELVQLQQPVVQSRISEQLNIFKPVMVTLINELENKGYVQRQPHPSDKRAVQIHMLKKGNQCLLKIRQTSQQASQQFFVGLSATEQKTFHEMLLKIANTNQSKTSI